MLGFTDACNGCKYHYISLLRQYPEEDRLVSDTVEICQLMFSQMCQRQIRGYMDLLAPLTMCKVGKPIKGNERYTFIPDFIVGTCQPFKPGDPDVVVAGEEFDKGSDTLLHSNIMKVLDLAEADYNKKRREPVQLAPTVESMFEL